VKKALFVCTANTCLSQMVQAIFDTLAEDEGLPFRTDSAGIEAPEGAVMAENAVAALEEAGDLPGAPQRTVVNAAMVEVAELCSPWIRDRSSRSTCSKGTRRWSSTPCQSRRQV
jgi:protein-tyrosine-phosphatase